MPGGITDIEDIVRLWAKEMFEKTKSHDQKKVQLSELNVNINWTKVKFIAGEPDYQDKVRIPRPNCKMIFKSTFENNTNHEQEHSFKTERTTSSSYTTCLSKGYTKGINVEIKLALPNELMEITTGFGREVSVENAQEETKEQSLTWSVDSMIKVPKKHKTTAEVVVEEEEFSGRFTVLVEIFGRIIVTFTNPRENNAFMKLVENDISTVLEYAQKENGRTGFEIRGKKVLWTVEGMCKFRYGIQQTIQLHENPL